MNPGALNLDTLAGNPVAWAIVLLGFGCYAVLFHYLLAPRSGDWRLDLRPWLRALPVLLGALPLLGLLGTINGLLRTFRQMSATRVADQQALLSDGIADALLTTQLGLVLVIPGWLLLAWLRGRHREAEAAGDEE